jgi:hypothetical protein
VKPRRNPWWVMLGLGVAGLHDRATWPVARDRQAEEGRGCGCW